MYFVGDRVDVALDVAGERLLVERALGVVLGLDHPLEVVERELGVDREQAARPGSPRRRARRS